MLKQEDPRNKMRHELFDKCMEKGLSFHTMAEITACMDGKMESEKEKRAERLLEIISTSTTEEDMIAKSTRLR